ncbi:MAG: bifunctional metallophosphatase/5'-nucleotidase [Rikenellaceae bacterium]|nr:bifunctional metallophosphatase/5'-nucleotidase [Rikenellaceae bacterium]
MRKLTALFATLILLAGYGGSPAGTRKLVLVSTNDIHSHIDNFPALVTLLNGYRSAEGVEVLYLDAGDRWTGSPYVDMAPEQYKPVVDLLNAAGLDIATFGNHEWDNGNNLLAKRTAEAAFVNILTNADVEGTALDFVPPYHIAEAGGLKLGFTGMVTTAVDGHPDGKLANFGGIRFHDPLETAERYAPLSDSVDLYILISHLGFTEDSILAVARPELDIIIGGHSHTLLPEGREIGGTLVTQTGKNLQYAGVTEITHRGGRVLGIDNRMVLLDTVAHDPAVAAMVAEIKNEPGLLEVVGTATGDMDKLALMNLFSDAMRDAVGADISFHNMGGMRIDRLDAGPITKAEVYAAEPFGNTIVTHYMTLAEVGELLLNKFNSKGKESHTLDLYPSGIEYTIVTDDEGNATDIFFESTVEAPSGRRFRVALSDYVDSVYKHAYTGEGTDSGIRIAFAAEKYINRISPVAPDTCMRVIIR